MTFESFDAPWNRRHFHPSLWRWPTQRRQWCWCLPRLGLDIPKLFFSKGKDGFLLRSTYLSSLMFFASFCLHVQVGHLRLYSGSVLGERLGWIHLTFHLERATENELRRTAGSLLVGRRGGTGSSWNQPVKLENTIDVPEVQYINWRSIIVDLIPYNSYGIHPIHR